MKIYFENLYDEKIPKISNLEYFIEYPNTPPEKNPQRRWYFDMPQLDKKGTKYYTEVPRFFMPEIPGNHTLIVPKFIEELQYAGEHGLAGRKHKVMSGNWTCNFYVSDAMEVRNSLLVSFAVMVSIITLFVSIISLILSLIGQNIINF